MLLKTDGRSGGGLRSELSGPRLGEPKGLREPDRCGGSGPLGALPGPHPQWSVQIDPPRAATSSVNLRYHRNLTDVALVALAKHYPGLTDVSLADCTNQADAAIVALAEALPGADLGGPKALLQPDGRGGGGPRGALTGSHLGGPKALRLPDGRGGGGP